MNPNSRSSSSGRRVLLALVLAACALPVRAGVRQESSQDPRRPRLEEQRERWEAKSPEERELLRRRFQEWRALPPERREELLDRARRWREAEEHERAGADEGLKRELETLPSRERERRWREHALERFRERGRLLLDRLPPAVRHRLEEAPPERRREVLSYLLGRRDERASRVQGMLGRRLGLPPERLGQLDRLAPEERRRALLELWRERRDHQGRSEAPEGPSRGAPRDGGRERRR